MYGFFLGGDFANHFNFKDNTRHFILTLSSDYHGEQVFLTCYPRADLAVLQQKVVVQWGFVKCNVVKNTPISCTKGNNAKSQISCREFWQSLFAYLHVLNDFQNTVLSCVSNFGKSGSRLEVSNYEKALISKSSRSSILKTPNRLHPIHDFPPESSLSEYLNFHTCLQDYLLL